MEESGGEEKAEAGEDGGDRGRGREGEVVDWEARKSGYYSVNKRHFRFGIHLCGFPVAAVFVEVSFTGVVAVEKCLATVVVVVLDSEVLRDE